MTPAFSRALTRFQHGVAESPTRSASFRLLIRPSDCSSRRMRRSVSSSEGNMPDIEAYSRRIYLIILHIGEILPLPWRKIRTIRSTLLQRRDIFTVAKKPPPQEPA